MIDPYSKFLPLALLLLPACATAGSPRPQAQQLWSGVAVDNRTAFAERLLAAHNRERARIGMPALTWDPVLAIHAQRWAEDLASRRAFQHSTPISRPGEGENLFKGTAGAWRLEEMIGGFIDEKRDFKPGIFPKVAKNGQWERVGHYTQLIWGSTTRVGCAIASNGDEDYLACRYSPPGNVVGVRVP